MTRNNVYRYLHGEYLQKQFDIILKKNDERNKLSMIQIKIKTLKDIDENKMEKLIKLVNKRDACKPC
jgi:hypothetical protein